ncbi:hypothetical protein ACFLU8_03115 [Chloroflexota bacterium]
MKTKSILTGVCVLVFVFAVWGLLGIGQTTTVDTPLASPAYAASLDRALDNFGGKEVKPSGINPPVVIPIQPQQIETQEPVVETICPPSSTACPVVETACPFEETQCPPVITRCPSGVTVCPPSETMCPPSETKCPIGETLCPFVSTECPATPTECGPHPPPPTSQPPAPGGAVGGDVLPINKISLIAPWIALAVIIIAGSIFLIRRRVHGYR